MKELNFSKNYDKLKKPYAFSITTIRGKTFPTRKNLKEKDKVEIKLKGKKVREAIISGIVYLKIKDIPSFVLKQDIAPEEFKEVNDFVKVLDKHWRYVDVTEETEVSVIKMVLLDYSGTEEEEESNQWTYFWNNFIPLESSSEWLTITIDDDVNEKLDALLEEVKEES